MKDLTKLLAKIESKLNLLLASCSEFEIQLSTIIVKIRQVRAYLEQKKLDELSVGLAWIIETILSKKLLRRRFEHLALDLLLLNRQLHIQLEQKSAFPADALSHAVQRHRKKLLHAFESLEEVLKLLRINNKPVDLPGLRNSLRDSVAVEQNLKHTFWIASLGKEPEIIHLLSLLTEEIKVLNDILIHVPELERIQALRKVLLHDWNAVVEIIAAIFKDTYRETKSAARVIAAADEEGVRCLEIQAQV